MQPRSAKLLEDVRDAAAFIREVTQDRALADYQRDRLLRQAVERNFEIIGEAINRLAQHDPLAAAGITDTGPIIAFRNIQCLHALDERVRTEVDLPELLAACDGGWRSRS